MPPKSRTKKFRKSFDRDVNLEREAKKQAYSYDSCFTVKVRSGDCVLTTRDRNGGRNAFLGGIIGKLRENISLVGKMDFDSMHNERMESDPLTPWTMEVVTKDGRSFPIHNIVFLKIFEQDGDNTVEYREKIGEFPPFDIDTLQNVPYVMLWSGH